jgi:hypothetical protein
MSAPAEAAPRTPVVAGIEPGAGASTLAPALHAEDAGLLGQQADVVVCRATPASLRAAAAVACPGTGPRPLLAVVGPITGALPGVVPTRFAAVVELPLVERWIDRPTPTTDAAGSLSDPSTTAIGAYADALRELVAALLASGQLTAAAPPMAIRPRPADSWRGTRTPSPPPSRHRTPTVPDAEPARTRHRLLDSVPCAPRQPLIPPPEPEPGPADNRPEPRPADPGPSRRDTTAEPARPGASAGHPHSPTRSHTVDPEPTRAHRRPDPTRPGRARDEDDEAIELRNQAG